LNDEQISSEPVLFDLFGVIEPPLIKI